MSLKEFTSEIIYHKKADVIADADFPREECTIPVQDLYSLAYVVTRNFGDTQLMHTPSMGRAGYYPVRFETTSGHKFGCLFLKGVGKNKKFQFGPDNQGFPYSKLIRRDGSTEIVGSSTMGDQYSDAQNSLVLNSLGLRVRLPLAGMYLTDMETPEGVFVVNKDMAKQELPYMSFWGMETPYRVEDLLIKISEGKLHRDEDGLLQLLVDAIPYLRDSQYKEVREFYAHIIDSTLTKGKFVADWLLFVANEMLYSLGQARDNRVKVTNFHSQQISLHGEHCDTSECKVNVSDTGYLELYYRSVGNGQILLINDAWGKYTSYGTVSYEEKCEFDNAISLLKNKYSLI